MKVVQSALSLNVDDLQASVDFAVSHLGFVIEMSADGVTSLKRDDVGFNLVFLRTGLASFRPTSHAGSAGQGTLVVFVVADADAEHERLVAEGVAITTPLQTEPWGQRFFQVQDPNGVVYEITHWAT
jgi:catechol 2,3-dioxygenase-like lactoylglutathione lyase family enzyme